MTTQRLPMIRVEKPWGRHSLWPGFADPAAGDAPVGEIWFDAPGGREAELLIKYLFTSERLSIQVHPDDDQARAAGYARGKEEAWIILAAEPQATIALGTVRPLSAAELRSAALDGSLETLMDWKPVKAGDMIYSPAGTIHAIGAGITLIEVQQNVDLTYRLYDYGRPRALHLDEGVAVSRAEPFAIAPICGLIGDERNLLVSNDKFTLERWAGGERGLSVAAGQPAWLIPVSGSGTVDGAAFVAGECWLVDDSAEVIVDHGADMLVASALPFQVNNLCAF
ncbi:MAG: class I mannose-6-phosphate isomerase [Sphingomonadaceae bacterium]